MLSPASGRDRRRYRRRVTDASDDAFKRGLALLRGFVAREGHAQVPARHLEDGFKLGQWVWLRRIDRRKGRLSSDRVLALEALPGWSWDPRQESFLEMIALLHGFVGREGHAHVRASHVEQRRPLGKWVAMIRGRRRIGTLSMPQLRTLEAVPGWSWEARLPDPFVVPLRLLEQYVEREGHARVPYRHEEDGVRLGLWAATQRHSYRKGHLAADRVVKLEQLPGWTWGPREDRFQRGFDALLQFVERHGHARVPSTHRGKRSKLALWARSQRLQYRLGRIRPERVKLLESLPGWTWGRATDRLPEGPGRQ